MQFPKIGRRTFTLTEILISLVLLATVSGLAIPAWFGRSQVTLDNATKLLARDLRQAQNRAAFEHLTTEISFASDGTGYDVRDERGELLPAPMGPGGFERSYPRDAVFRGVRIEAVDFAGQRRLRYDDRGAIELGGTVVLSFNGDSRTLHVDARTGLIELEGLSEPWVDSGL